MGFINNSTNNIMGDELEKAIGLLAKLPGFGSRSARRAIMFLMKNKDTFFPTLLKSLNDVHEKIDTCSTCGNFDVKDPCSICTNENRDTSLIIVVEDVSDLWALERAQVTRGRYHVLGGVLAALEGVRPENLHIDKLITRAQDTRVKEILLAMNATVEGQSTAHYIMDKLAHADVQVSQLARGMPLGGELDYMDEGTLRTAVDARKSFS